MEDLSAEQKIAVVAHYYDGLKISEIAGLLDCSEGAVRNYLRHAKKILKKGRRCRLRFFTPMLLYIASEALLTSKAYTMTATDAHLLYGRICDRLRLN